MKTDELLYGVCDFALLRDDLIECRAKSRLPENAKSVITVLFPYNLGEEIYKDRNISRYSVPPDYHKICMEYLEKMSARFKEKYPGEEFVCFCDNSPIREVRAAVLCGLGTVGKNGLLINDKYGSYVFIGEIVTTAKLKGSNKQVTTCINCGRCASACPTGCISQKENKNFACLSSLTQKKGELNSKTAFLMKKSGIIWGCDICQEVCPMNKGVSLTDIPEFKVNLVFRVSDDTALDGRAFGWRGKGVIKRNLDAIE